MDEIRTVGAAAGFRWIWGAINIGRRGPGAIFGGAGLLLLVVIVVMTGLLLAMGGLLALSHVPMQPIPRILGIGFMLVLLMGIAFGLVGYLRLIDAVESGREARAADAFRGFADFSAGSRTFAIMLVIMVVQQAVTIGLIVWFLPDLGRWYLDVLHGMDVAAGAPPALPSAFWKFYPASVLLNLAGSWVQSVAICQVSLGGRGIAGALGDGIVSLLRNLSALLVLFVVVIALALGILVIVLFAVLAVVLIAKLVAMWLAVVLALILYFAFFVAMIAVGCASMYYIWRDTAGPGDSTPLAIAA